MSDITLLTSMVEVQHPSSTNGITMINLSGEPYAAAILGAVIENYSRVTEREHPSAEELEERIGEKVTLILGGENMIGSGMIIAREGKLFVGSRGGVAILPKGKRSKGYRVEPERVIDMLPGWVAAEAAMLVASVVSEYPRLTNLTQERLARLPGEGKGDECSLAVFGANPFFGAKDCLWLIGEYWPEDDICDRNVLLIRPEYGTSEHGSCYGRDLLRNRALGEVIGFEPIPFDQALKFCDLDFDEAIARVFRAAVKS